VVGKLSIGDYLFANHYAIIDCHFDISIGDHVLLGPHAYICDFDHDVSTTGYITDGQHERAARVIIEDNVWIGANTVVLKGVVIHTGAVVGAGAVVTDDIPANAIAVGVPARVVRLRHGQ
jgi:acetyltransferase-like isoleucine patch superfamily enzyme